MICALLICLWHRPALCTPVITTATEEETTDVTAHEETTLPTSAPPLPANPSRDRCTESEGRTVQRQWSRVFDSSDGGLRRITIAEELFKGLVSVFSNKLKLDKLNTY